MAGAAERAFVGVGANLGDAETAVRTALLALEGLADTRVVAKSSLYRSAPLQASGPDFINAVAELRTCLPAAELLQRLHGIEAEFGRVRSVRNAPRTLDLDLLMYGDLMLRGEGLQLPHPRAHRRAFVLLPLAELDASLVLPGLGPIGPWLRRAADQRVERVAGP
jgi:2-amino-4-hydroxy-6-hydroxymethyldihydropteridine diphosphokinase